ncbi:hypothetical protein ABK040_002789 [Willaertia magna]
MKRFLVNSRKFNKIKLNNTISIRCISTNQQQQGYEEVTSKQRSGIGDNTNNKTKRELSKKFKEESTEFPDDKDVKGQKRMGEREEGIKKVLKEDK